MKISEFIGRTITLFHRVDWRIPQRINLKMLPMRNAGLRRSIKFLRRFSNSENGI
ncbi:MAG: hypothetical protein SGI87_05655 [Flavobacteriales bacterium]|nr:hypothetical protein [Flavobacteriales bacterium]